MNKVILCKKLWVFSTDKSFCEMVVIVHLKSLPLLKLFNTKGYFTCSLVPVCDRMEGQPPLHSTQQGSAIGKQRVEIWKIFLG